MNTYTVGLTERAEVDADDIFLRYNRSVPDQGDRWQAGFVKALASLSSLPNRCPIAREDDRYAGIVVRRLLFGKYRILFHVVEPGRVKQKVACASSASSTAHARLNRKKRMTTKPQYGDLPTMMRTACEWFERHPNGYEG